jgi:L-fuconolactonase
MVETPSPIWDTHQHLWDLERFRLPWLAGAPALDRSFLMADYEAATAGLDLAGTIYMEVDVAPEQLAAEAEAVLAVCERGDTPMVAAVIGGRPAAPGFEEYLRRFRDHPRLKGVRQVLHGPATPPGTCLQPEFVRGIRRLGELGLSFDVCVRAAELGDAVRLVDACPATRFILDHCGNPDVQAPDLRQWRDDLAALAARGHVVCKVSGIVAAAKPGAWRAADLAPVVDHVLAEFGPDRVMFGGDWPVCTLAATFREWVEALRWIVRDRADGERRKLFHDNAVAFYGVE